MISIGIVADSSLHIECLEEVLGARNNIEVVATATTSERLDALAREVAVVLVDHAGTGAHSTIRRVAAMEDGPPMVVFGVPETEHHIVEYVEAGAAGIALCGDSVDDLVVSIQGAIRNELYCKPRVAAILANRLHEIAVERGTSVCGSTLTEREVEIVELLDKGLSNKEIARRLDIRVATVKNHVHNILAKLNVNRRGEAAAILYGRLTSPAASMSPGSQPGSDCPD